MLLKNLMEDKQLNFDQPFLSVRRVHAAPAVTSQKRENRRIDSYSYQVRPQLPTYRSELKSGPIRNPGAVPFLWEHSPGQPKEESNAQARTSEKPPIAPMLPPGRHHLKAKQPDSRVVSRRTTRSKNQAVDAQSQSTSEEKKQDVSVSRESRGDENVKNVVSSKGTVKEAEDGSDTEDSNEAYVDARDTLSRTEYSFLNCSMSGLSGIEDLDSKPRERFSTDPEAREFMMDRFLPAAKAMASETPHAPKKQQPVQVQQQQQQTKKTANQCSKPSLRYGPSFAKKYSHYNESEEEEEESDDEYDQRANLPSVCGLLPRFCLKSSLGRLSPVPATSVRTRGRPRSSSSGSYTEMENESISGSTEVKSINKIQRAELDEDKATLRSENGKEARSIHEGTMRSKGLKTFVEILHDRGSSDQLSSGDPISEKTVYVDTVHKVESPNTRPFSPNTPDSMIAPKSVEEDAVETQRIEQMNATDSPHGDVKKPCDFGENQDFERDLTDKDKLAVTLYNSQQNHSGLPAPPPLPKSPSDSWLGRTLPSMATKGSSLRPYLGAPESNCFKAPAGDMKWETIVKTTKVQESLSTIPEA